jgi:hypothetical protein
MAFDHEKLDVYRLAVLFSSGVGERLEGLLKNSRTSATKRKRSRVKPRKNCQNLQEGEKTGRRFSYDFLPNFPPSCEFFEKCAS